jgi:hypothetical protein
MATLIWRLADYPLPDHASQLEVFINEARFLNPDGTTKPPKKRKASSESKKNTPNKKPKKK